MMHMRTLSSGMNWTIVGVGLTHLLCCGMPFTVNILNSFSALGLLIGIPHLGENLHLFLDSYGLMLLAVSFALTVLGWGLHFTAAKLDCRTDGACRHGSCAPRKKKAQYILYFATVLLVYNAISFLIFNGHITL